MIKRGLFGLPLCLKCEKEVDAFSVALEVDELYSMKMRCHGAVARVQATQEFIEDWSQAHGRTMPVTAFNADGSEALAHVMYPEESGFQNTGTPVGHFSAPRPVPDPPALGFLKSGSIPAHNFRHWQGQALYIDPYHAGGQLLYDGPHHAGGFTVDRNALAPSKAVGAAAQPVKFPMPSGAELQALATVAPDIVSEYMDGFLEKQREYAKAG